MKFSSKMNESDFQEQQKKQAKVYERNYEKQVEYLYNDSLLSRIRKINAYDVVSMGEQLAAFDGMKKMMNEIDGSLNQLGVLPRIAHDVIAITYGASVLPIMASVQPIEERRGLVYMKQIKAWDNKGNFTPYQTILDPRTGIVTPISYAKGQITNEVGSVGDGINTNYAFATDQLPLRGTLIFSLASGGGITGADDSNGVINGVGVSGTVDYTTGNVVLNFAAIVALGDNILVSYVQNYEGSTDIPQIQSFFDSVAVEAKPYTLKATVGLMESYELKKRFGLTAEEEIAKDLISEINAEVGGELVQLMFANAVGNTGFTVNPLPAGVSWNEHKQQLIDKIFSDAGAVIVGNAGRGVVSLIVAGNTAAGTLTSLPGYEQLTDGNTIGVHVLGTLRGVPIVRVPETTILPTNIILAAYKGSAPWEAPMVYAPYMPLVTTDLLPMSPNPLMKQRGAAMMAAVQVLIGRFITKITLTY